MAENEAGEGVEADGPENVPEEQVLDAPVPEEEAQPPEAASEEQPAEEPPSEEPPSEEPPSGELPSEEPPSGEPPSGEPPSGEPPSEEPPSDEPRGEEAPSGGLETEEPIPEEAEVEASPSGTRVVKLSPSGEQAVKESSSGEHSPKASPSGVQPVKETPSGEHAPGEPPVEEEGAKPSPSAVQTPKATPSVVEAQKTPSGAVKPDLEVIVDRSEEQASTSESSEAPSRRSTSKLSTTSSSFIEPEDKLRPPDKAMEDVEKIASGMMEAAGFPARYGEESSLPALSVKSGTASVHFQPHMMPLSSSVTDVSGSPSMRLARQFKPPQGSVGSKTGGLMSRTIIPGRRPSQESSILLRRISSDKRGGSRAGSILSFRKYSTPADYLERTAKTPKFMNTYRLESKRPFVAEKVNLILQAVMAQLEDVQYDPSLIPKRCIDMAGEIRNKVKLLGFDRYKLVVVVDIGEKNFQGVCSAFRFLWDCERDNYTYHKFENMFLYAVASVFGVYYD